MLHNIEAVIFDIDGTLLDSNGVWQQIDEKFMDERGLDFDEKFQQEIDGMTFHQVAEYSKQKYNLAESPDELMTIWKDMARDEYANNIDAKSGAIDFIHYLNNNGFKLAVCTSNSHELIDPALKRNNIYDCFDIIYTATNIGDAKDDPAVYIRIASQLGVEPKNCLVFDDIHPVIDAVNKAGMRSCVVADNRSLDIYGEDILRDVADYYINDFRDINY